MAIEASNFFNEPLQVAWNDVVPRLATLELSQFDELTRARLELEPALRVCGLQPPRRPIPTGPAHRIVLVRMLTENDSPLSASLRATAAAVAGPLRLQEATPILRLIALDEPEDTRTRLGAIDSYITLAAAAAANDLTAILRSDDALARSTAVIAAVRTKDPSLTKIATAHLRNERHPGCLARVSRCLASFKLRLPKFRAAAKRDGVATSHSDVKPVFPAEGRRR